ncbi:transketolase [Candidatus Roizmanbacteria bacterium]|nr:transketolase [Candidatus Roizmanbacteria bacterium]
MNHIAELCKLVRYNILTSTTAAGSGHPTSSMSGVELLTTLFFNGYLRYDLENPRYIFNDRVIFSKGHAAPLLYALYQASGVLTHEELLTLRQIDSRLEGHPTPEFDQIDVSTGSLGQGLSVGFGMALGIKAQLATKGVTDVREPKVYVLMGDSEFAEGQIYEALQLAGYYKTNNLVGILDVNRLGQRGETMEGWDIATYADRVQSFGWDVILVEDGHDLEAVNAAFAETENPHEKPVMIIAKTMKGKGVLFLENQDNWHGKAVPKDQLAAALSEVGEVNLSLKGKITPALKLPVIANRAKQSPCKLPRYNQGDMVATREAYGEALAALGEAHDEVVVLDAETSNSTFADKFKAAFPERFYEMFIAEQNMVSTALGMSKVGFVPFASSFAAFLARAYDQIRMSQYSHANVKIVGSHAGVSIGSDGSSQMALEDIAMLRAVNSATVLYPSDATSTASLTKSMSEAEGLVYLRTTREKTAVLYPNDEQFPIGGSKIVRSSTKDKAVIFAAGITLHEALKAYDILKKEGVSIAVVDLYSVKPLDVKTVTKLAKKTGTAIVVEDHYPYGGIGEAVATTLTGTGVTFKHLAVHKTPHSGTPAQVMRLEEIDAQAIAETVRSLS